MASGPLQNDQFIDDRSDQIPSRLQLRLDDGIIASLFDKLLVISQSRLQQAPANVSHLRITRQLFLSNLNHFVNRSLCLLEAVLGFDGTLLLTVVGPRNHVAAGAKPDCAEEQQNHRRDSDRRMPAS